MKMFKRCSNTFLAVAALVVVGSAQAAVHRVYPGESIQNAIDVAAPGDTILVEPGDYYEDGSSRYGLRITTDNLRLIGKVKKAKDDDHGHGKDKKGKDRKGKDHGNGHGKDQKVRLIANGAQETGVLAAPAGCEYDWTREQCAAAIGEDFEDLKGFYIRGFSVEEFPVNGIQTRWVDGFEFVRNESANNLNNGIYPTLSANGLVRNNESYGSLDTAMWVAGSENVRVIGNELYGSVIGFEITVSNNVEVKQNEIYGNTVGVGLFHPNGAGNPPLPVMANWVIEHNDIYENNLSPNPAPPGSFQADLPPGAGVLLLGVSDHVVAKNNIEGNDYVGIGLLGWCTALAGGRRDCGDGTGLVWPPEANNNRISQNYLSDNGGNPPPLPPEFLLPDVDLLYLQFEVDADESGNCFEKNKPNKRITSYAAYPSAPPPLGGPLPTAGC